MPLLTLTFVVFLVLKLTDTIDWSWWWITAPLWGGLALVLSFLCFGGLIAVCLTKAGARVVKTIHKEFD